MPLERLHQNFRWIKKDDYDHSPTFDSDVSDASRSIIGRTIIDLRFASDQPQALIAARLDYVNTNGSIERVS